ncbi:hypothetical protein KM92DES2_20253 [uncultured Desulfovibrio sp.]|uniref:Uncharacterized protein n=1 Tax=uncultured Desulfovibrio sp. TaxID=167968 RepID=A0A212KJX2_9BACT|nr:hypothetical protein KM92DES2_20253 [uncultured Desulfovibrio sp.]
MRQQPQGCCRMLLPNGKAKNHLASDAPDAPLQDAPLPCRWDQQFEKLPPFAENIHFPALEACLFLKCGLKEQFIFCGPWSRAVPHRRRG